MYFVLCVDSHLVCSDICPLRNTFTEFSIPRATRASVQSELAAAQHELADSRSRWSSERAGLQEDKETLKKQKDEISYLLSVAQENVTKVTMAAGFSTCSSLTGCLCFVFVAMHHLTCAVAMLVARQLNIIQFAGCSLVYSVCLEFCGHL